MAKKKKSKKGKVAGGIGILAVIAALGFFGGKGLGLGGGGGLGLGKDANVNADADKQDEKDPVENKQEEQQTEKDVVTVSIEVKQGQYLIDGAEKSLADMQGSTVKLQLVGELPEGLDVLHESKSGRLSTYIIRGGADEVTDKVASVNPAYFDVLPLSLEEIFIYELGGVNYEVKNIIL